jgi:hypothetical protein
LVVSNLSHKHKAKSMAVSTEELEKKYQKYAEQQQGLVFPKAKIQVSQNSERVNVKINIGYKGINYRFKSVTWDYQEIIYKKLDDDITVRARYADGKTRTPEQSAARLADLVNRFRVTDDAGQAKEPNLFSGFVVEDEDTDQFLGLVVLGGGKPGTAEIARMNVTAAWSHPPTNKEAEAKEETEAFPQKSYRGVGTAESWTMLLYAKYLRDHGHTVKGEVVHAMVATAREDNEGSWKSSAQIGLGLKGIKSYPQYGPELRYELEKELDDVVGEYELVEEATNTPFPLPLKLK